MILRYAIVDGLLNRLESVRTQVEMIYSNRNRLTGILYSIRAEQVQYSLLNKSGAIAVAINSIHNRFY